MLLPRAAPANPHLVDDLLRTSFFGPYTPAPAVPGEAVDKSSPRQRQVITALGQWWHAAKFGAKQPHVRDKVLHSPTLHGAYLMAKRHQALWRDDWETIRMGVLKFGLASLALQCPELGLMTAVPAAIAQGLKPLRLPTQNFVVPVLDAFCRWRTGPRVAIFGAEAAPMWALNERVLPRLAPLAHWTLLLPSGRVVPWEVHDFALRAFQPVLFGGDFGKRFRRSQAADLIAAADLVIVLERRGDKRFDSVIQETKARKKKLVLELYDTQAPTARQLSVI